MCGIAGIIHTDSSRPVCRASLKLMCDTMKHRGPDDFGEYLEGHVGLGMRRLSIIDVKTGQQPMANEDGSIQVVFNGEIYNYRQLRKDLESGGHELRTTSDTEVIVHLYEEFGEDCIQWLRGMFAVAIWDSRHQRLLLARDRLGIKPLYYCWDPEKFHFASEIKCLLAMEGFDRRMNLEAFSAFLTLMYIPGPMTIYEGIHELPPGHICVWSNGKFSLRRYWKLDPKPEADKPIEFFIEGLRHHLREAVKLHLVSDVPLGAFLSGGIDSSAVVAFMAEGSETKVRTFTVGFQSEQPVYDERRFARRVAETIGTDHSECLLSPQVEEVLPAIIRALDEPFADSSMVPNFLVCQAARQLVTVALSGLGGDELFAGYERYRGALLSDYYLQVPRVFRHGLINPLIQWIPESQNGSLWGDRIKRFIQGTELGLIERYQRYVAAYDDLDKEQLLSTDLVHELERRGLSATPLVMNEAPPGLSPLDRMLWTDMHTYLPHDLLKMTDRLSMCHALEVRVPFLDHKLVEFVSTIPSKYKLRRWQKKHILIRALHGILPREILHRRKQGFSIPLNSWLRGPLHDYVQICLGERALSEVGLFRPQTIARIRKEHDQGIRNHESKIWVLLTFMLWHELYIRNQPYQAVSK